MPIPDGEQPINPRGRLTIFLGYAHGVGKTFAMLRAAIQCKADGKRVLNAWVDTHGQPGCEAFLSEFPWIPPRYLSFTGETFRELDSDAVVAQAPDLALVDDLAHANAPGSRYPWRYQDIQELLDQGISVYTTLNIFNLESLRDITQQITAVVIRNTIPDDLFDAADEVELVDLPPEELIRRYQQGIIHLSPELQAAAAQFYRIGNLTALRELALRRVAERVNRQMRDYMQTREIPGPWPAAERLLVCVSAHPLAERLVRTARRLATSLNADWFVLYVETPDRLRFSPVHQERLQRTMRLAEDLGAHVVTIAGRSVAESVAAYARENNITKVIVGLPYRPRWQTRLTGSVVDEIIRLSGPVDVYVISDPGGPLPGSKAMPLRAQEQWPRYLQSALLVILATLIGYPIHLVIQPGNLVMLYLLAVVISALFLGRGPSIFASLLSVLAFDFFLTEPRLSLSVADTQYIITFFGLFLVSVVISNLAGQVNDQVNAIRRSQAQTATLYALSRELTNSPDLPAVLHTVLKHVTITFERHAVILLPGEAGLEIRAASPGYEPDSAELQLATWAFLHGQPAGRGTAMLPQASTRYQPLATSLGVIGVLGVKTMEAASYLSPERRQLLEAYSSLAALAIERARLSEQANQTQMLKETEKIQTALLNSISHDLRTPLAAITGIFSSLHEAETGQTDVEMDEATRVELISTGWEEAERMNRLVGNLLDMTRLQAGAVRLNLQEVDIEEIIGTALARLKNRLVGFEIRTEIPPEHPLVRADFGLIEQVLVNLLDNAVKYSAKAREIEICVSFTQIEMRASVADRGPGIAPEDISTIFEKFYRSAGRDRVEGTGLGLSICKGVIEAHGGRIWAENRSGGGAVLTFTLPAQPSGKGCEDE